MLDHSSNVSSFHIDNNFPSSQYFSKNNYLDSNNLNNDYKLLNIATLNSKSILNYNK